MVKMFWMIVGAISVPLVYGFLRTKKFYDGVLIVAPGYTAFFSSRGIYIQNLNSYVGFVLVT